MSDSDNHEVFMRAALVEARKSATEGNQGVGSVIVKDGQIVATGRNLENTDRDPTGHAETVAIRNFANTEAAGSEPEDRPKYSLDAPMLAGALLYTTFEPCPMCCGAILSTGVSTVVMGGRPDSESTRWGEYTVERLIEMTARGDRVEVVTGVLVAECFDVRNQ